MGSEGNSQIYKKIGARILSEREVSMILPTYSKLQSQITEIRDASSVKQIDYDTNQKNSSDQRTNNISILGARGSGKTSVLKTFIHFLSSEDYKAQKKKNIILPMVIPENMSDSMNLMATVLGLFKTEVDGIVKTKNRESEECWNEGPSDIERLYKNLVKKYCYIQNEYRQVIIGQYTTENDYVKRSSVIFNSDIEFINCFNEFVEQLLREEKYTDDALIFLFIDDIDLSTNRCTDVVKTLLSYLSHYRIVTFLSGDLDTFEEALTMDFVRQEKMMRADMLNSVYINSQNGKTMLKRKQALTYEYLKKVIPPVYRHTIKKWELANRGNYIAVNEPGENGATLKELFSETLKKFFDGPFFQYYDYSNMANQQNTDDSLKIIPEIFHLLDDTSRGLNNVYNVLLDMKDTTGDPDDDCYIAVKLLLETLVSANPIYNDYRNFLFEDVIQFGNSFETTVIRCDNFFSSIQRNQDKKTDESQREYKQRLNEEALTRFQLFVFLDFSIRVLKQTEQFKETEYRTIKKRIILDMINYPIISGSTKEIGEEERLDFSKMWIVKGKKALGVRENNIMMMMIENDFIYALTFYQYVKKYFSSMSQLLSHIDYQKQYGDRKFQLKQAESVYSQVLVWFYWSFGMEKVLDAEQVSDRIKNDYEYLNNVYASLDTYLSPHVRVNVLKSLFPLDSIISRLSGNMILSVRDYRTEEIKALYKIYRDQEETGTTVYNLGSNANADRKNIEKKITYGANDTSTHIELFGLNFINSTFGDILFEDNRLKSIDSIKTSYVLSDSKDLERFQFIEQINKLNLWDLASAEIIKDYVIGRFYTQMWNTRDYYWGIDVSKLKEPYKTFDSSYGGVSDTIAKQTKREISKYYNETMEFIGFEDHINIYREISKLANNWKAWYGRQEAQAVRKVLDELPIQLLEKKDGEKLADEKNSELMNVIPWLHVYALFRMAEVGSDNVYRQGGELAEFSKAITLVNIKITEAAKKEFDEKVQGNGLENLDFSHMEELFDSTRRGNQ